MTNLFRALAVGASALMAASAAPTVTVAQASDPLMRVCVARYSTSTSAMGAQMICSCVIRALRAGRISQATEARLIKSKWDPGVLQDVVAANPMAREAASICFP